MAKSGGIKPADSAIWSGGQPDSRPSGSGGGSGEEAERGAAYEALRGQRADQMSFSGMLHLRGQQEPPPQDAPSPLPGEAQLLDYLRLMRQGNDRLRELLQKLRSGRAALSIPSALGLSLQAAAAKLKQSELKVGGVSQEFSTSIPSGHVISQAPGPGSRTARHSGVSLVVSKGPPPEAQGGRKQRRVPYGSRATGQAAGPGGKETLSPPDLPEPSRSPGSFDRIEITPDSEKGPGKTKPGN